MVNQEELVFGVGFERDADGHPIERGHGNLTDQKKKQTAAAVAAAPAPTPAVATAPVVTPEAAAPAAETPVQKVEHALKDIAAKIEEEIHNL